ncbi:hypothetical protein O0L34_g12846 [Tuta absoluta]|nr:hypothetical protein O0L34_g12846 [Tuta absoluta]
MPGAAKQRNVYGDYEDERAPSPENQQQNDTQAAPKTPPKKNEKPKQDGGGKNSSGWLGGILTKLSLRPPNQMILPDDKDPTIVWDPETKRWRNKDGDENETDQPPPPPPKLSDLAPQMALMQNSAPAPSQQPPAGGGAPVPRAALRPQQRSARL